MRATRVVEENIRGVIRVRGIEFKDSLSVEVRTSLEGVKVSSAFGPVVFGRNLEDGLGRMVWKLLEMYYELSDKEELCQEDQVKKMRLGDIF
jgi:hypothetical protein